MKGLLLLLVFPIYVFSQNTIGLPDFTNYSKQEYGGGLQNWDIKQDRNGLLYVANNEGMLSFDGRKWTLHSLPNKTIVRSIEIAPDGKIYVGGQDELGYFAPDNNGKLKYHSLTVFIPAKDRAFGDVWDIVAFNKDIYFRSDNRIFKFTNESVAAYTAISEWAYLGLSNGRIYAHDFKAGLLTYSNGVWSPLFQNNPLPTNDAVTGILNTQTNESIITTLKNGLFSLSENGISKVISPNTNLFQNERIYAATKVNTDWMALATSNSGVYITDFKGNIVQQFSRAEGLQNNNVLSIFLDNESNLWLGLDNGIDLIAYNSAIKQINPSIQDGSGYTSIIHDNRLYIGTSNGVFSVALQPMKDLSFSKGNFLPVANFKGQTWGLAVINNQLLLGHHDGAFVVSNNNAQPISKDPGYWNFTPMSTTFPTAQIVAGNYKGLGFFYFNNNRFLQAAAVPGFSESSRFVAIDKFDNIWVSHPYHGVYRISKNSSGTYGTNIYTDTKGLPSALNNHVYKIRNEVIVATEKGVYEYNPQNDVFEPSAFYKKLLGDQSIRYLKEDTDGNIWFIHEKTLGVIDFTGKEPAIIDLPELKNKMLSGFEFIYPVNSANIFLGGEKGFYHINYEKYKQTASDLMVQVRSVRIIDKTDSLLFGGYFNNINDKQLQDANNIPKVGHNWKTLNFEFSSSHYGHQSSLEYSYRLKGFDDNWSDWTKRTEKEYTNLRAGTYTFEVKVRNNLGKESPTSSFAFEILPPWYQTVWASLLYLVLFGALLYAIYIWQRKKFMVQQEKYEEEQKKLRYIHELELNKTESELVALRNEKLEAEINFKNSELASSAMHLFKKGELLTKMKSELSQVTKELQNPQAIAEVKKMIKTLSEDDNLDKEWEHFSKHFDKVHGNFVASLKEKHPAITGNELKLSAYLRMNLSTKEIAQLMNISVRGVEISRYRLRKKLGITSEVSLFDYLMNLSEK